MWQRLRSPIERVAYYTTALGREALPHPYWRARWERWLARIAQDGIAPETAERLAYYNKLEEGASAAAAPGLRDMAHKPSYYYYDLRRFASAFDRELQLGYVFGDVDFVPAIPSVVKSRPIGKDNANGVLMKLDRLRHYRWPHDSLPFEQKAPRAVWRGVLNTEARRRLVELYGGHAAFDIGHVQAGVEGLAPKARLSIPQQLTSRYVISLEGNDVATNLKWIMASNSLCLMPRPRYETWFMEGALVPGCHYAELRADLSDLEETVAHYERHPEEARRIISEAHAHVARFADTRHEALLSFLVLQKYFERTGQLERRPLVTAV